MGSFRVAGKVALVTGAARGIGLETARALHRRGAAVALVDLDRAEAEAAAARVGRERTLGIGADVRDEAAVAAAVAETVEAFGGLDVAVANAGIAQPVRPFRSVDPAAFEDVLAINLGGVVKTVRQALPHIVERRGHILVISSVYAFVNGIMQSSYAMSKAAVEQLGRALRVELAPHGASAGVGYFGFVDTAMVRGAFEDPITEGMQDAYPRFMQKQITPAAAGEALAAGIERRAARTIRPRRWAPYSALRGLINPLFDAGAGRNETVREVVLAGERAGVRS